MILLSPFEIPKGRGFIREVGREGSTRRFAKENKKSGNTEDTKEKRRT